MIIVAPPHVRGTNHKEKIRSGVSPLSEMSVEVRKAQLECRPVVKLRLDDLERDGFIYKEMPDPYAPGIIIYLRKGNVQARCHMAYEHYINDTALIYNIDRCVRDINKFF